MKRIAIFGSTGSIGSNTLEVIGHFPERFRVICLVANNDIDSLYRQVLRWQPKFIGVACEDAATKLRRRLGAASKYKLFCGADGLESLSRQSQIDQVVLAISGAAALGPLLACLDSGKKVALANKEALVMAGSMVTDLAKKRGSLIIPVDSEQSAIWQCLEKADRQELKNIYLTASGGPLLRFSASRLKRVSPKQVLKHPRWNMGVKITVDSATLMNKGLEVLEAMFLFGVGASKIKVLIHPEAIIHSMVEFVDGALLAQLSATDMRIPIQYALSYPDRLENALPRVDFAGLRSLNFEKPDLNRFPCLGLAYRAGAMLGTMPAVLNAANEKAVEAYLAGRVDFMGIPRAIEKVMDKHKNNTRPDLGQILQADRWAREQAERLF